MNVTELVQLTKWISREIEATQIVQKYTALFSILQQNIQSGQTKQPIETYRESLIETLNTVPLDQLTNDQLKMLDKLEIAPFVGTQGISNLENILFKNVIDEATASQNIQAISTKISNGISKSNSISSGLVDTVEQPDTESNNEITMRVCFTGESSMSNIADFKEYGATWYDIGRGIAMAHNASPEDIKILGASKGSIIIELGIAAAMVTTVCGIILSCLKVAEKIVDLKKKVEELRGMKLSNDKAALELENEVKIVNQNSVDEISNKYVIELAIDRNNDGDKVTALTNSIKKLIRFIENGGIIDFVAPEDSNTDADKPSYISHELRLKFQEIRALEKKLSLLEHQK